MSFETKYACDKCNHVFYRMTDHDPRKVRGGRPPSCPACKKAAQEISRMRVRGDVKLQTAQQRGENINEIIATKTFPSHGKGAFTKAMDETAKIVMEDYNLTDLRDNLRTGDDMVPKLRPDLEAKVGTGFGTQKNNVMGLAGANLNSALTGAINSNRFAKQGDVVAQAMTAVQRPPTKIVGDYQPERPS